MHSVKSGEVKRGTIRVSVFLKEQDYKQLRIERFRRHITSSQCLSQALNEMLEDQKVFSEVLKSSRIECKLKSPKGSERRVLVFLPLDIIIKLNDIYQKSLVGRDLIISQAFNLYSKRRKEGM